MTSPDGLARPASCSSGIRRARWWLALLALAVAVAGITPASAQESTEQPDPGLELGYWWAFGLADGTATATRQGITIDWTGEIFATFDIFVNDDGVSGTWEHSGDAEQRLTGTVNGIDMEAVGDLAFMGSGDVGGRPDRLRLTGESRTTGTILVSTPVGRSREPVDVTSEIEPLRVDVDVVDCDRGYGNWAYTVESAFEAEGFSATMNGYWLAFRDDDRVESRIRDQLEHFDELVGGPDYPFEGESVSFVEVAFQLMWAFNDMVDRALDEGVSNDELFGLLEEAEALLNFITNLSECDRRLFGEENLEMLVNVLSVMAQQLIVGLSEDIDSELWQRTAEIAARSGVLGPGAPHPADAVAAEQALIDAGEAILEASVDPETGEIQVTPDTIRVMSTGAAMGWEYHVNGRAVSPRDDFGDFMAGGGA